MEALPQEYKTSRPTQPKFGEIWELMIQNRKERVWEKVDESAWHWETLPADDPRTLKTGRVYRIIKFGDNLVWQDVLDFGRQQELLATAKKGQVFLDVNLDGVRIRALIDSGATGNFISPEVVIGNR